MSAFLSLAPAALDLPALFARAFDLRAVKSYCAAMASEDGGLFFEPGALDAQRRLPVSLEPA